MKEDSKMNAQAIHGNAAQKMNLAGLFSRRSIWSNPKNGTISVAKRAENTPLLATRTSWEAYVVDSPSEGNMHVDYPKIVNTSIFHVTPGQRPTGEISAQYLAEVRGQVTEAQYALLAKHVADGKWVIATVINSTQPA